MTSCANSLSPTKNQEPRTKNQEHLSLSPAFACFAGIFTLLALFTSFLFTATLAPAAQPDWWTARGVLSTNAPSTNDFAAANLGQLKWAATNALTELDTKLSTVGGAGTPLRTSVFNLCASTSNDFRAVNLGMLKNTAAPFYDRLGNAYPWTGLSPQDYAAANVGQLKNAFNLNVLNITTQQFSLNLSASGGSAFFNLPAVSWYPGYSQVPIQAMPSTMYDYFVDWKDLDSGTTTPANPTTVTIKTNRSFLAEFGTLTNGLILYYSFNTNFGGNGNSIIDESGQGHNGYGWAAWTNTGKVGGCITAPLSVSGQPIVYVPGESYPSALDGQRTICAWIRSNGIIDPSGAHCLLYFPASGYFTTGSWSLFENWKKQLVFSFDSTWSYGQTIADNVWYFLVITEDTRHLYPYSSTFKMYLNGVQCVSMTDTTTFRNLPCLADMVVGSWDTGYEKWNGQIDELMVFNGILSSNTIMRLYNATAPGFVNLTAFNSPAPTNQPAGTYLEVSKASVTNWYKYIANNAPAFVPSDSIIKLWVTNDYVLASGTERDILTGYLGTGQIANKTTNSICVTNLTQASTVSWQWQTNYWANLLASGGCGHLSYNAGWYPTGTILTNVTAIPDAGANFIQWTAGVDTTRRLMNPINVSIASPTNVTALISTNQGWLLVNSLYGSPTPARGTNIVDYGLNTAGVTTDTRGTTQYVCMGWTGSGSVPATGSSTTSTFNVSSSPSTITWQWATNYFVTTSVSPSGYGSVSNNLGWYRAGATATVTAVHTTSSWFRSWSGTGISLAGISNNCTLTFVVTNPVSLSAIFDTCGPLTVQTAYGTASPYAAGTTTVNYGTPIVESVPSTVILDATQYVCVGWTGTGSVPDIGGSNSVSFSFAQPTSINWSKWTTNFQVGVWALSIQSDPSVFTTNTLVFKGSGICSISNECGNVCDPNNGWTNNWWYCAGSNATLTAIPANGYIFLKWILVDVSRLPLLWVCESTNRVLVCKVDYPVLAIAYVAPDSDGDGILDWWENAYGLNPYDPSDANESINFNGTNNLTAYRLYGSGYAWIPAPINSPPPSADSDGDGLPDYYEGPFFGTGNLGCDSDGDGLSDGDEIFIYGTNPNDAFTCGNGIPDGWAVAMGLNPLNPANSINLCLFGTFCNANGVPVAGVNPNWNNLQQYQSAMDTDGDGLVDYPSVNTHVVPLAEYRSFWLPATCNFAFADPTLSGYCQNEALFTNSFRADANSDGFSDAMEIFAGANAAASNNCARFATNNYSVLAVSIARPAAGGRWGVHLWTSNNVVFTAAADSSTNGFGYACVPRAFDPTADFCFSLAYTNSTQLGAPYAVDFCLAQDGGTCDWVLDPDPARSDPVAGNYPLSTNTLVCWWFVRPTFALSATEPLTLNCNTSNGLTNSTPLDIVLTPSNSPNGFLTLSVTNTAAGRIKLYSAANCAPSQEIALPCTWAWSNNPPARVWLRGTTASLVTNDVTLVATYSNALLSAILTNRLPITVVDASVLWAHKYALANSTNSDGTAQVCVRVSPTNSPVKLTVGGTTFNTITSPNQMLALGNGTYMAAFSNWSMSYNSISLLDKAVTNGPVSFVKASISSPRSYSGISTQRLCDIAPGAFENAYFYPSQLNGIGTNILNVYTLAITNAVTSYDQRWTFGSLITDTFGAITSDAAHNNYQAVWKLPVDLGLGGIGTRQIVTTSEVRSPLANVIPDGITPSPVYPTYSITHSHGTHNHTGSALVRFSSTDYPTSTFTLVCSRNNLPMTNIAWSVTPNNLGSFLGSGNSATEKYVWNCPYNFTNGIINASCMCGGTNYSAPPAPFIIVNNLLTLTPGLTIIPTNAPQQFLAFPAPGLPTNNLVSWQRQYGGSYVPYSIASTTTGGVFNATAASDFYNLRVIPNNWCSAAIGCATVCVCDVALTANTTPTTPRAQNVFPGAMILRSASTADCSRLVPLSLALAPSSPTVPFGHVTLTLDGAGATNYLVWTNAAKLGAPFNSSITWLATNFPATLYIEGVSNSVAPRDLAWILSYRTNLVTANVVTDSLYTTVMDASFDAYGPDKVTCLTNTLKRAPGLFLAQNALDADRDGCRDDSDARFNGPADSNAMGMVVFRQMPGITNFVGLSNVFVRISGASAQLRLFRFNPTNNEPCLISNAGDNGISSSMNIASQISTGDVRMLVEGRLAANALSGSATIALQFGSITSDYATVTILPTPADSDDDGLCLRAGGSLNNPEATGVEPVSFLPWTTMELGRGALPGGLAVSAALTAWYLPDAVTNDTPFLRRNFCNLDTRVLPDTGDGLTRVLRPNGRIVAFDATNGLPQMPDLGRTYRLVRISGNYVLVFASGFKHYFDSVSGVLLKVEDPNGTSFAMSHVNWPSVQTRNAASYPTQVRSPIYGTNGALTCAVTYDATGRLAAVVSDYTTVTFSNQANGWSIKTAAGADAHTTTLNKNSASSITILRNGLITENWIWNYNSAKVVTRTRSDASSSSVTAQTDYTLDDDNLGMRVSKVTAYGAYSGGEAGLSTSFITRTDPAAPGFGQVKWIIAPDSGYTFLAYDTSNRVTNTLSSIGAARLSHQDAVSAPPPDPANCRQTVYDYTPLSGGADANAPVDFNRPRTSTSYYKNTLVAKEYRVYGAGTRETQVLTNLAAAFNDLANLKTLVTYDPAYPGFPSSSVDPCGNTINFAKELDGDSVKVTASVAGDPAGEGTITWYDKHGWVLRTDRAANGVSIGLLASNTFDTLGHTLATRYADGRSDAFQCDAWGYCTFSSNREGVISAFYHDALLRTTNAVCNNVTTRYSAFDSFGNAWTVSTFGAGTETQTLTRVFDGAGRLLSETAPFTGTTTYDTILDITGTGPGVASGNLFITTRGGRSVTNESYRDGTPAGTYGSATHPVSYEYGLTNGRLYSSSSQFPKIWTANNLVNPSAGSVARTVATTLDAAGRPDASINADATAVVLTTDRNGRTTCHKDENGNMTFLVYDVAGRLSRVFTDMNGNSVCDAGDKWTRWVYAYSTYNGASVFRTDTYRSDVGSSEVLVGSTLERVDGQGVWSLDPFGKITYAETSYAGATRTAQTTLPNGTVSTVVSVSNLVKSVKGAAVNAATTVQQDGFLRTKVVADPRVGQTAIQYTPGTPIASNRVTVVSPEGATATTRDQYNQLVEIRLPDGVMEKRDYFATGEPARTTGGHDLPQSFDWLATGEMTGLRTYRNFNAAPMTPPPGSSSSITPGGATTVAAWSITNATASIPSSGGFDGVSDVTRWEYNLLRGWPEAKVYADNTRHTFGHAPNGWVTCYTNARQIGVAYGRDAAGQMRTKLYTDNTPGVTNTWNQRDLVIAVQDAAGLRTNVFDAGSRLVSTVVSGPSSHALAMLYATNSDERATVTLALGASNALTTTYAFGANGLLTRITAQAPMLGATNLTFNYTWLTNAALLSAITFPNGQTNEFLYQTNADRVAALRIWPRFVTPPVGASAAPVLEYAYLYDAVGRCTNYSRPYESRRDLYAYDQAGHLVQAQRQVTGTWSTASWLFDTAGNRVAESNAITGIVTNRLHNGLNQIWTCAYDADGNLTGHAPWTYTWDAENRLTSVKSNGLLIATYQYDSQNRRIFKTVGTTTYRYIYDGWNLVAEVGTAVPSGPATTNIYVWGADHTGSLDTDSGGVRGLLAIISGASVYYPVMNNHGDVMALFDATGTNIVARYERDPFGVLLSSSGPAAGVCALGFQSKYCDVESGLVYFGHRYYAPTLGIFISRDPLEEEGGVNLYGYGKGCPGAVDPKGLTDMEMSMAAFMFKYPKEFELFQDMAKSGVLLYRGQKGYWFSRSSASQVSGGSREVEFWLDKSLNPEAAADQLAKITRNHALYDFYEAQAANIEDLAGLYSKNLAMGEKQAGTFLKAYVDGFASFIPGYGAIQGTSGKTVTGRRMPSWERALQLLPAAAMVKQLRTARSLDEAVELAVANENSILGIGATDAQTAERMAAKNVGYHATKPQNAPYIMEQGVRSSAGGRLGEGVYVSDTVEGAIAEYNAHNPGLRLKPAIIEVEYSPGVNLKVSSPSQYYEGPLPFTQGADSLTAPSVRPGGAINTVIRNGTAVPVRRVQ